MSISKVQDCPLATDVQRSELHVLMETVQAFLKVAKLANKGLLERYIVRNLPKFAEICQNCSRNTTVFAEKTIRKQESPMGIFTALSDPPHP